MNKSMSRGAGSRSAGRKIIKTGHSLAVTIPSQVLKDLGLKLGDSVKVCLSDDKNSIIIKHGKKEEQLPLGFKIRAKVR